MGLRLSCLKGGSVWAGRVEFGNVVEFLKRHLLRLHRPKEDFPSFVFPVPCLSCTFCIWRIHGFSKSGLKMCVSSGNGSEGTPGTGQKHLHVPSIIVTPPTPTGTALARRGEGPSPCSPC